MIMHQPFTPLIPTLLALSSALLRSLFKSSLAPVTIIIPKLILCHSLLTFLMTLSPPLACPIQSLCGARSAPALICFLWNFTASATSLRSQDIVNFLFGWITEAVKICVLQGQNSKWNFGSYFGLMFKEFMGRIYPVVKKNPYWNSLSGLVQCYNAITAKTGVHYQSISHFIGLMHKSLKISNLSLIV